MHTEHLQNVRFGMVAAGWLVAVSVASLIIVVLLGLNLLEPDSAMTTRASVAAIAIGFFVGGLFTGLRTAEAPILHGTSLGLASLVVWFALNVISASFFPDFAWQALSAATAVTVVLIMIIAAVVGARFGYRITHKRLA